MFKALFNHNLFHFNAIAIADANEIHARCIQMKLLQTVHFVEMENVLSHQVEHADL